MNHPEDKLQIACMTWFRYQYPDVLAFHVPNGGKRSKAQGGLFKAMGTLPGVADILIFHRKYEMGFDPMGTYEGLLKYSGLAIELKWKSSQRDSQKVFEEKITKAGWIYVIVKSFDDFQTIVNTYLK